MFNIKKLTPLLGIMIFCFSIPFSNAQLTGGGEANSNLYTNQESLEDWQDMRFGMFIHWGPVTLRGTEIGWSRGREITTDDYDRLYKEFNPVLFDADEWVRTAKQAGMRYLIITAKHHDGFSLWDTEYSDYNIMNTPYGKDVLKALAEACEKQGIEFGIYYSIADWYHPDHPVNYPYEGYREDMRKSRELTEEERRSMARYVTFMKNQLRELIENYDPVVLWFDGEWEWAWTHEMGMDLYAYLRNLDPDLLINNRVDRGRQGMQGMTISDKYAGDFSTPEQEVGNYNTEEPWESAITIGKQWAWRPNDELKSTKELTSLLLNTIGGDGNLLLNVGPMMDGRIEQRQSKRLQEVGEWLDQNGRSIYGTRGGPYMPTESMVSTRKGNKIFLHLLDYSESAVTLPIPEGIRINNAEFISTGEQLDLHQMNGNILITLPSELPDDLTSVIELELNESAEKLSTIERTRY